MKSQNAETAAEVLKKNCVVVCCHKSEEYFTLAVFTIEEFNKTLYLMLVGLY